MIQLVAVFCGQVALYSGFFSQICQLLFTEKLLTGPAVLDWLRKTKKSFTAESKVDPKGDVSIKVDSEDEEEDEIPIIKKDLLEKFVAEVSF